MNLNRHHPLIESSPAVVPRKTHVSIHSEDRNVLKYPSSSQFVIDLPSDMNNVSDVGLAAWSFPSNYSTFSELNNNITLTFTVDNAYTPPNYNPQNTDLQTRICTALTAKSADPSSANIYFQIESGFYSPEVMSVELTNKFNKAVSEVIATYFSANGWTESIEEFYGVGGYTEFIVVYHTVSQNIWFGNKSSSFTITNSTQIIMDSTIRCSNKHVLADFSAWGLPPFLGLSHDNVSSETYAYDATAPKSTIRFLPRFYHGDVVYPGDNGYWLRPNSALAGATAHWLKAPYKINLMGPSDLYLEINELNHIDETSPFNVSTFTATTNQTNSRVGASFAKLPVPSTPVSQWFDKLVPYVKTFSPPLTRMRKISVKVRYHNGQLVNFGLFNYTFVLEFTTQHPTS